MLKFVFAEKLDTRGSALAAFGKAIVIFGRLSLTLSLLIATIFYLFIAEVGAISGAPLALPIVGWLVIELCGSLFFVIGTIGKKRRLGGSHRTKPTQKV